MFGSVRRRTASVLACPRAADVPYLQPVVARDARFFRPSLREALSERACPLSTIKSSREIDAIFRDSQRVAHPLVTALISSTPEGRGLEGRVAFIAGKRLGNAVVRNRSKRVLREAAKRAGVPWAGVDVVLIASAQTRTAASRDLDKAFSRLKTRTRRT